MASINLNNLKQKSNNLDSYTYTDFHLDISLGYSVDEKTISYNDKSGRDIKIAIDMSAIKNSLRNLFNTAPGERILLPDYGCDLREYIFSQITINRGKSLRRTIIEGIQRWEPRVKIGNVRVFGKPSTNEYEIDIKLYVPFLEGAINISSILTESGYTITG